MTKRLITFSEQYKLFLAQFLDGSLNIFEIINVMIQINYKYMQNFVLKPNKLMLQEKLYIFHKVNFLTEILTLDFMTFATLAKYKDLIKFFIIFPAYIQTTYTLNKVFTEKYTESYDTSVKGKWLYSHIQVIEHLQANVEKILQDYVASGEYIIITKVILFYYNKKRNYH